MKILLINPKCGGYPISLGYIGASLKEEGHKVTIIEAEYVNDLEKYIKKYNPDIVGINFPTKNFSHVKYIAKLTKSVNQKIKVIVGGPHPTALPKETASIENIDFVVYGEGEFTIKKLVSKIENNEKNLRKVSGIAFKKDNKIIITRPRKLIKNLDKIHHPHDILPTKKFHFSNFKYAHIFTSRGCPFGCIFCPVSRVFGNKIRAHSIERVMKEIKYLYNKRKVRVFRFDDPTFNFDRSRVIDLCRRIVEEGFRIKWTTACRIDFVDEETLKWMKRAGCIRIECGIESGNQDMQKSMCKNIDLQKAIKNCKIAKKVGVEVLFFFIFGLPGENKKTILETINFSLKSGCNSAIFSLATPYPGTRFYEWAKRNSYIIHENWDQYDKNIPLIETPLLNKNDLIKARRMAYIKFYFRFSKILEILKKTESWELYSKVKSIYFYRDLIQKLSFR